MTETDIKFKYCLCESCMLHVTCKMHIKEPKFKECFVFAAGHGGTVSRIFPVLHCTGATSGVRCHAPTPSSDTPFYCQSHFGVPSALPYSAACL